MKMNSYHTVPSKQVTKEERIQPNKQRVTKGQQAQTHKEKQNKKSKNLYLSIQAWI